MILTKLCNQHPTTDIYANNGCYMTPSIGTSHSNEVILGISGDASAVKAAVLEARQVGLELLIGMGSYPEIPGTPYL